MNVDPADPLESARLQRTARDVRADLLVRISLLHSFGGLIVFAYLSVRFPASRAFASPWINDAALVVGFQTAVAPLVWLWVARSFRARAGWALDGRAPGEHDREQVLTEPFRMAVRPFAFWLAAIGVIGGGISLRRVFGASEVFEVVQIMLIGGMATCGISYLVIERTYRPLFAFALAGSVPSRPGSLGVRMRILLAWAASSGIILLGVALSPFRESASSPLAVATLAVVGLGTGLFSLYVAADSIAEPLDEIRDGLARVALGDLSVEVAVDDGGEVGQVQAGFNAMVAGLRERHELQDLFGRHVGEQVAARALEVGTDLGGEQRRASMIFVDLIGSTAMAEVLPPGEVVATLNAFFATVVEVVTDEGGWVNKFDGDGALCVFGVPGFLPDHEERAFRAANRLRARLAGLAHDHPGLDAALGVSSGVVVAGNVGSEHRFEYTVIGRPVNEAARLTELAKKRTGRALASGSTVKAAGTERDHWIPRGRIGLRGQQVPTELWELEVIGPATRPAQGRDERGSAAPPSATPPSGAGHPDRC